MSMNPLNDITAVYLKEVLKPQLGQKSEGPASEPKKDGDGTGATSEKRIRQAVYDIRYRSRREDVPLQQAFSQYMSHTSMNAVEKNTVKEKLGMGPSGSVKEELVGEELKGHTEKKYQVRVKDKLSGKSYVRSATRTKINQLRSNPNISSVEMTKYGSPYEGEKSKGEQTAKVKSGRGLDQDGDGDTDFADVMSARMQASGMSKDDANKKVSSKPYNKKPKKVEEGFSDWRNDLREVVDKEIAPENKEQIKEMPKNEKNTVVLNPTFNESIKNLGGELIEMTEIELQEKITAKTDMGAAIRDFQSSKSSQLAGRTKEERRKAAIAAVLTARRGGKKLGEAVAPTTPVSQKQQDTQNTQQQQQRNELQKKKLAAIQKVQLAAKMRQVQSGEPLTDSYDSGELVDEERASERRGLGSPESPLSYPGRKTQKERGQKGGRHQYSGSQEYGGAARERGRKKSDPQSQAQRLRSLSTYPEKPGKYSEMQRKKRGGDIGSRFD